MTIVKNCAVCGSLIHVRPTDAEVECKSCGSIYDVLIHGSVSPEKALSAEKSPTRIIIYLQFPDTTSEISPGYIMRVGEGVKIKSILEWQDRAGLWRWVVGAKMGANLSVRHRLNTGAWQTIFTGKPPADSGWFDRTYTITKAGTHTWKTEYPGDEIYAGCGSEIHALEVSHYAISPEVSLTASPALTVIVKDAVTKKLIEGAHVLVDAYEAFTDADGKAVFEVIPPGTYMIWAEARDYKPVTFKPKITLTEAGMVFEIALWPIWSVALAAVGGTSVVLVGTAKAMRWI